jgi:ribosomal protein L7/L12
LLENNWEALTARLDHIEGGLRYATNGQYVTWAEASSRPNNGQVPADIAAIARAGHTMEAIKRLRELTGLGLNDAAQAIKTVQTTQ